MCSSDLTPDEIWKGLKKCKTVWGRNQLLQTPSKAQIIFDGYNANPESMKVLLENVQNLKADHRKIGVFGQMLEMGEASEKFHAELGEQVGSAGFAEVFFYGKDFELFTAGVLKTNPQVQVHAQLDFTDSLALQLAALVKSNDLVVVKGSRGMRLERMILQLNPIGFNEKK